MQTASTLVQSSDMPLNPDICPVNFNYLFIQHAPDLNRHKPPCSWNGINCDGAVNPANYKLKFLI